MPANHGQLKLLTSTQETLFDAAKAPKVSEFVKIYWPDDGSGGGGGGGETTIDVTFECPTFFTVTGNDAVQSGGVDGHLVAWVQSDEVINTTGDQFDWIIPNPGAEFWVGTATYNCPTCTPVNLPDPFPDYCYFPTPYFSFYYTADENEWGVYEGGAFLTNGIGNSTTQYAIRRNSDGKAEYIVDGVVVATSSATMASNHRLCVVGGTLRTTPSAAYPEVNNATFTTGSIAPTGTAVDWEEATFFNAVLNGQTISYTEIIDNPQIYAQTTTTIGADGDAFQFIMPRPETLYGVTIGLRGTDGLPVDCGDEFVIYEECGWTNSPYAPRFIWDGAGGSTVSIDSSAYMPVTADTVYTIRICGGVYQYLLDGVLVWEATGTDLMPAARLAVWLDWAVMTTPEATDLITNAVKFTDYCGGVTGGGGVIGSIPKVYSWWNALADSTYTTPLTEWLDGASLVPAFIAKDPTKSERFHNIPRTAATGDDVIQMEFSNYGQVFETLCYKWRGGVKVEVYYFFPEIPDDAASTDYTAINIFTGTLRKADEANADFVRVSVTKGFRSPHLPLPSRLNGSNCQWYFNGEHDPGIVDNPCDYDLHLGGTRGVLLDTFCNHTKEDCERLMGDLESYGGDDAVTESSIIGRGDHTTVSRTIGNESRLIDPLRVVYGTRHVRNLQLARYAKEYNPSEDNQDAGTIRTVFKVSEGPIDSITNVKVMDRPLPRSDGLGLEVRLGDQRQSPTTFSPSMLNLNRTAHFRGDINPVDPNGVQAADIVGECDVVGRNTVNIYDTDATYTQEWTNNRIDCLIDLLTNQWYGYRLDIARFNLDDVAYLRALESPFDCDVQSRTVQQQIDDICLAGRWFPPFVYNGQIRILPIEYVDINAADVPILTDAQGVTRNILWDSERNTSRLQVFYRDDDEIPNAVVLTIEDADHGNIERPLTFESYSDQYKEGNYWGDTSKRRDPKAYAAYGLTHVDDVRPLGEMLVQVGPFAQGGLLNNCSVEFTIDAISSIGLNLHENKVVNIVSSKLDPYLDHHGNKFQYFLITSLYRNSRLELVCKAQAWATAFWDEFCEMPGGTKSGYIHWTQPDADVIDGPNGAGTRILSASADRTGYGVTYPDSITVSNVRLESWTHTIEALPSDGHSYDIHTTPNAYGFKVWHNGQGWIYYQTGTDTTTLPLGSLSAGDQLKVEYDYNLGAPTRKYYKNGTLLRTDSTSVVSTNVMRGTCNTTGDVIGETSWTVTYTGCTSDFAVQPVSGSGTSATSGSGPGGTGTTEDFDVLAYQMLNRAEDYLQLEIFG